MTARVSDYGAANVAVRRGLGALLPPEARLCDDPFGTMFGPAWMHRCMRALLVAPWVSHELFRFCPWLARDLMGLQVRTRVLDDITRRFVESGGRQMIVLGAGYDCRIVRLADLHGDSFRAFEVDQPHVQARKRRVIGSVVACAPVAYLAWTFGTNAVDQLPDALANHGHDRTAATLTLLEGVVDYLTEDAVAATFSAIRAWSAAGSRLAFTYTVWDDAGDGRRLPFFWKPEKLPRWLAQRGYQLRCDRTHDELATRLLPKKWAAHMRSGRHIAVADVAV